MFTYLAILMALGTPGAHAARPSVTTGVLQKCAADLAAEDGNKVREALQKLIYLPLEPSILPNPAWTRRTLDLVLHSSELGSLAALVYLRFTKPARWGDVRTLTDFVHLPVERHAAFRADLQAALADNKYVVVDEVREVRRLHANEWLVIGELTYTRRLPAMVLNEYPRLEGENLTDADHVMPSFGGRNVLSAQHRVRLAAPDSADLAYVDFQIRYVPGADENRRQAVLVDTSIEGLHPVRHVLKIPRPPEP